MGRKLSELNTMISEASEAEKQNSESEESKIAELKMMEDILKTLGDMDESVLRAIELAEEECVARGGGAYRMG